MLEDKINPVFENMIDQNLLPKNSQLFSIYLGNNDGALTFGKIENQFKRNPNEEFAWAKLGEKNYWTLDIVDIYKVYNDEKIVNTKKPLCPIGCKSFIDTAIYFIYGPSALYKVKNFYNFNIYLFL